MAIIKTILAQGIPVKQGTQGAAGPGAGDISSQFDFATFATLGGFAYKLINLAFSIAALMVVFYFIIAAIEIINSQGDKAHLVSARSKIYHSIIGFILLIVLYLIIRYLIPALGVSGLNIF